MLAGISHDLRTPLTRLRLETEMSPMDTVTRDAMIADIEQMDAIIGQFLNYARPPLETVEPVDLSALVHDAVGVYAAHDDVRVHVRANEPVMAVANRMEVQRILDNLVENARRYAKDELSGMAVVEISTRVDDKEAVLTVADHGNGVPDGQLSLLTRPLPARWRAQRRPAAPGWACPSSTASCSATAAGCCWPTAPPRPRGWWSAPASGALIGHVWRLPGT